jgi:hypothetical protein
MLREEKNLPVHLNPAPVACLLVLAAAIVLIVCKGGV